MSGPEAGRAPGKSPTSGSGKISRDGIGRRLFSFSAFRKENSFAFSEYVFISRPSRLNERGVARDRHDTRGGDAVAARDRSILFDEGADERSLADVKS
ncbi:hypothetical protein [Bradyrhizobium oligotrophicum]|uniref:hypothetical protein n=1 Tax=Bradyrhizobium oligotrophicum TaxID=44255 RepID=UPI001FCC5249|nr:hypothetical protein [Bradyrhizobium oligotrophicum]